MTYNEFVKISTMIRDEMNKADADVMDYQKIGKVVATLAMFQLMDMGANDNEIRKALGLYTDSIKTELEATWSEIKRKCVATPN